MFMLDNEVVNENDQSSSVININQVDLNDVDEWEVNEERQERKTNTLTII